MYPLAKRKFISLPMLALAAMFPFVAVAADPPMKPILTASAAERVMAAALKEATRLNAPGGTIAIVDDGGHLLLLKRLDNTMPGTPPVATGKAWTAATFKNPTAKLEEIIRAGRTPMLNIPNVMPMQGGIPLKINGYVVAGIGVSGAASAPQDEEIPIAGAKSLETGQ